MVWNCRLWHCQNYQYGSCIARNTHFCEILTWSINETGKQGKFFYNKSGKVNVFICQRLYFNKKEPASLQLYCENDSSAGVLLWILPNIWEHLFYRKTVGSCFHVETMFVVFQFT